MRAIAFFSSFIINDQKESSFCVDCFPVFYDFC